MEGEVRNLEIVWSIGQCWLGSEEVMALLLSVLFSSLAASFWLVLVYLIASLKFDSNILY
jgi:hypothetical protein